MPLYLYTCHTCELDLEELHPLGQAPPQSIRCPLCGGMFTRDVALFHVNSRKAAAPATTPAQPVSHGVDCLCCTPRSARSTVGRPSQRAAKRKQIIGAPRRAPRIYHCRAERCL